MLKKYKVVLKVNNDVNEVVVFDNYNVSIVYMTAMFREYFNKQGYRTNIDIGVMEFMYDNGHICHYHVNDKGELSV